MKRFWVIGALLALSATNAIAAPATNELDAEQQAKLIEVQQIVRSAAKLADAGVITPSQRKDAEAYALGEAKKIADREVGFNDLMILQDPHVTVVPAKLTSLQKFAGLITTYNVLLFFAVVAGVLAIVILFRSFFMWVVTAFLQIPIEVWEGLSLLVSLGLIIGGYFVVNRDLGVWVGLPGCLLFGGSLFLIVGRHTEALKDKDSVAILSGILTVVWGASAFLYGSHMLGYLTIAALLSTLGFSMIVTPMCYGFGFKDDNALARAGSAGFALLALFTALRIAGVHNQYLALFEDGSLMLGSIVGYLGMLIASSRWCESWRCNYVIFQILSLVLAVIGVVVGSVFGISPLQKVAGTFFAFWAIEKMMEIPTERLESWAVKILAVSGVTYLGLMYLKAHPAISAYVLGM